MNSPASSPTIQAAKAHGISVEHAFLLGDIAAGFAGLPTVWPEGHHWRIWALTKACQDAGPAAVLTFLSELTALYRGRST